MGDQGIRRRRARRMFYNRKHQWQHSHNDVLTSEHHKRAIAARFKLDVDYCKSCGNLIEIIALYNGVCHSCLDTMGE